MQAANLPTYGRAKYTREQQVIRSEQLEGRRVVSRPPTEPKQKDLVLSGFFNPGELDAATLNRFDRVFAYRSGGTMECREVEQWIREVAPAVQVVLCSNRPNRGYNGPGYTRYVLDHYGGGLGDLVVMSPSHLNAHGRTVLIADALSSPSPVWCYTPGPLKSKRARCHPSFVALFHASRSGGCNRLTTAEPRRLGDWAAARNISWSPSEDCCGNSVLKTTRDRILTKPLGFYEEIDAHLVAGANTEAMFYLERLQDHIFGGLG